MYVPGNAHTSTTAFEFRHSGFFRSRKAGSFVIPKSLNPTVNDSQNNDLLVEHPVEQHQQPITVHQSPASFTVKSNHVKPKQAPHFQHASSQPVPQIASHFTPSDAVPR